jgi:Mn-dependent DtxR family transcriptional regulator
LLTNKGFIAHDKDDTIVLFEEGKKIASTWKIRFSLKLAA